MNTVNLERNTLRPSNLDKLALCNWFKSTPVGEAAKRGTQVDDLLRAFFCKEEPVVPDELRAAFRYGAETTLRIAGELYSQIITAKKDCAIRVPGLPDPAECDCIIPPPKFASVDWKTGQVRDYTRQQAAYAFGQMSKHFSLSWTCAVIYVDQQETAWHRFTFKEAREIVQASIEQYADPQSPSVNPLCGWCANFNICPAQRELAGWALSVPEGALDFETLKADPELLGKFLAGCHALEHYEKQAREAALGWMLKSRPVPFYALSKGKRSYYVPPETLIHIAKHNAVDIHVMIDCLELIIKKAGPVSRETYQQLCSNFGVQPDPTHIKEQQGDPFIRFNGTKPQPIEDKHAES